MKPSTANEQSVVVLSPHRDDAAFSCGLALATLLRAGKRVCIANVCTSSDYAPYSTLPAAPDPVTAITRLRAEEDDAYAELLQRVYAPVQDQVQLLDLAWQDAPLRLAIPTHAVLGERAVSPDEVARLVTAFQQLPAATVLLVPLALGGHMDHRLVRDAAIAGWPASSLVFYQDLPYACRMSPTERERQTQRLLPWPCLRAQVPPAGAGDKRRMALCYGSQIAEAVADEMEADADALGWTESFYGNGAALRAFSSLYRKGASTDDGHETR